MSSEKRICELEAEIAVLKEQNEEIAKSAADHVSQLEDELREAYARERKEKELNISIAQSAEDHVSELIQQIALLSKENDKLRNKSSSSVSSKVVDSLPIANPADTHKYIYKGYMDKKSPSFPITFSAAKGGWQTRYFVLSSDGILIYWTSKEEFEENVPCKGILRARDIVREDRTKILNTKSKNNLRLVIQSRVYDLVCESAEEANKWYVAILSTFP